MVAIINVLIAALLAYVAWQNYQLSEANFYIQRDKLRLDLFDRRLKVFESCQSLFSYFLREGKLTMEELSRFTSNSSNVEFLFGGEVDSYVKQIRENGLRTIHIGRRFTGGNLTAEQRSLLARELEQLEKWFTDQISESSKLFRKYLHFSINKDPK